MQDVDRHESAEKREKERGEKSREGQDRKDADKKQLEDEVKELQKHRAWECGVTHTHDDLIVRPGSYALVRLHDWDPKRPGQLWWALAEVLNESNIDEYEESDGTAGLMRNVAAETLDCDDGKMMIRGKQWSSVGISGNQRSSMAINDHQQSSGRMMSRGNQ